MKIFKYIFILLFFGNCFGFAYANEAVLLTKASGGEAIPASSMGGNFTLLSPIVFKETAPGQIGPGESDLIINLPAGFEFDIGSKVNVTAVTDRIVSPQLACQGGSNRTLRLGTSSVTSQNITPTINSVTVHIKQASAGDCKGTLTFSGMKVRPITADTSSGNITYNGSTSIAGIEKEVTNLGTLTIFDDIEEDETPPVITLNGPTVLEVEVNTTFTDPGAEAIDDVDGEVSVEVSGTVDTSLLGEYTVSYSATDEAGNSSSINRIVQVVDTIPPLITLNGASIMNIKQEGVFADPGAVATDNYDEDLEVSTKGKVDTSIEGTYIIEYSAVDSSGNEAIPISRTVNVVAILPPVITLLGSAAVTLEAGEEYIDAGATAIDGEGNDISNNIKIIGLPIDTLIIKTNTITYSVSEDREVTAAPVARTVQVVDTTPPTLHLIGDMNMNLPEGSLFTDPGATAYDVVDGDMTSAIEVTGIPVSWTHGDYVLTYFTTDSSGNTSEASRDVHIMSLQAISEPIVEHFSPGHSSQGSRSNKSNGNKNPGYLTFIRNDFSLPLTEKPTVLGASTQNNCSPKKIDELKLKEGNQDEIRKLQDFLNKDLLFDIPLSGMQDDLTSTAFEIFKLKYQSEPMIDLINQKICSSPAH